MISRGLLISLGITTLCSVVTYLYFTNKIDKIEKKMDIIYKLIQSHNQLNEQDTQQPFEEQEHNIHYNQPNNLIAVSENSAEEDSEEEEDENSDDSAEEDSAEEDSDEEEDENSDNEENSDSENNKNEEIKIKEETLNERESEKLSLDNIIENSEITEIVDLGENNNDDVDSLDELSNLDEEESNNNEVKKINLEEENKEFGEEDLKKLNMTTLKNLANEKGLTNYKSLKKQPLIDLLMAN